MIHVFYITLILVILLIFFLFFKYINNKTITALLTVDSHLTNIISEQDKLHLAFNEFKEEKENFEKDKLAPRDNVGVYKMGYYNTEGDYVEQETADIEFYTNYYENFSEPDYKIPTEEEYYNWFYAVVDNYKVKKGTLS